MRPFNCYIAMSEIQHTPQTLDLELHTGIYPLLMTLITTALFLFKSQTIYEQLCGVTALIFSPFADYSGRMLCVQMSHGSAAIYSYLFAQNTDTHNNLSCCVKLISADIFSPRSHERSVHFHSYF